jgi:uncharacterized protein YndB with AHSA1/START domain
MTIGIKGMTFSSRNRWVARKHSAMLQPFSCMSDVTRDITLPVEPDKAWDALLAPGWMADEAEVELREGGAARFVVDGSERHAIVEEAVPGERLVFWWWTADERGVPDAPGTRVAFELEPVPGGTRVTVRESATGPFCLALA